MKHIVSVSLGSSKRNKVSIIDLLGETFKIERIGTDGDPKLFVQMFRELDGKVDALGVGGADIYLVSGKKRYAFKQVQKWISSAKQAPVVDGSGLKHTLERETIYWLQQEGIIDFSKERVFLVMAVDRFGMAEALYDVCPDVVCGDILFGLGLPMPIHRYSTVQLIAQCLLPIITKMPLQWFYPTGKKQEERTPKWRKVFGQASIIAGDWHYIRRYAPEETLRGKVIITQSLRRADIDWLSSCGVKRVITTTPMIGGETFATNVMEAVLISLINKPLDKVTDADYLQMLDKLAWRPSILNLEENSLGVQENVQL